MKAIFTIVTKNYLPLATILGDSIRKLHKEIPFYIFIADEINEEFKELTPPYPIIELDKLKIDNIQEMTFKYNVTEFCTAVKPYCFEYLFEAGYEKIIYLDPDIYVFSSLENIFSKLDSYAFVLTPHLTKPEVIYTGILPEGGFLNNGTFNLGFLALSNVSPVPDFLPWWKERLNDKCYVDLVDGYFTDQKWIDFVPTLFSNFYVLKSPAYNLAIWNLHEREVMEDEGIFKTKHRGNNFDNWEEIVFVHFSSFSFGNNSDKTRFFPLPLNRYIDFEFVAEFYRKQLMQSEFSSFQKRFKYSYQFFSNGIPVLKFHRRFFRRMISVGYKFNSPFDVNDRFYKALKRQKLVYSNIENISAKDTEEIDEKVKVLNRFFSIFRHIVGIKRYALFCRLATRYFRYENQVFLLNDAIDGPRIGFLNDVELNKNA